MTTERGVLEVRQKKGGGQTIQLKVGAQVLQLSKGALSAELEGRPGQELNGREVEFERILGQPRRVRPVGGVFTEAAAAAAPVAAAAPRQGNPRQAPAPPRQALQGGREAGPQAARRQQAPNGEAMFRNPYNFIPAPPRDDVGGDLGDQGPVSPGSFDKERYTGTLRVQMTVKTPMLLPDADQVREDDKGHKTYPLRLGADGLPMLAASSVRGMLRSAYEAVTNSRYGRFSKDQHEDRLAFRMETQAGLKLIPARIQGDQVHLLTGTSQIGNGRPNGNDPLYGAWLPRYHNGQLYRDTPKYPDGRLPEHGDEVECWLELIQHARQGRNDFQYWSVRKIAPVGALGGPGNGLRASDGHRPVAGREMMRARGWVCVTNANIKRKHDERVFFVAGQAPRGPFAVTTEHRAMWRQLIKNYQEIHEEDLRRRRKDGIKPDEYLGDKPGETALSRHVYTSGEEQLSDGTLCYVRLNAEQTDVEALFPVNISRELYAVSPWDLCHPSLRPASSITELSPADRVFGWVHVDAERESRKRKDRVAARGQLQVGPVRCDSAEAVARFEGGGLPLAILSTPKPQQGRFYVAGSPEGEAQADGLTKKEAGYSAGKRLRGRKVYPHQRSLPVGHWEQPSQDRTQQGRGGHFQEYHRPGGERDGQNRSVLGWVKPGARFSFDLHVQNLSEVELGALLWVLSLPKEHYLRQGGGKPLGFGSVHLEIESADVCLGCKLSKRRYSGWEDAEEEAPLDRQGVIDTYKTAVESAYGVVGEFNNVSFIAAFVRAARGYEDELPTRYPRVEVDGSRAPTQKGESFKWFVENERSNERGRQRALQDLATDEGLPMWQVTGRGPRR
jgi:CRISPR-associated protein (TIGR03986 family)